MYINRNATRKKESLIQSINEPYVGDFNANLAIDRNGTPSLFGENLVQFATGEYQLTDVAKRLPNETFTYVSYS